MYCTYTYRISLMASVYHHTMYMYMYIHVHVLISHLVYNIYRYFECYNKYIIHEHVLLSMYMYMSFFLCKSDCFGYVVLLSVFLVVCMTLLASFFLLFSSLINMHIPVQYIHVYNVHMYIHVCTCTYIVYVHTCTHVHVYTCSTTHKHIKGAARYINAILLPCYIFPVVEIIE